MSKILIIPRATLTPKEKMEISEIFNKSLTEISKAIEASIPIYESVLFMNDYSEKAAQLNRLISMINEENIILFEVEDNFSFEDIDSMPDSEINSNTLSNILESAGEYA